MPLNIQVTLHCQTSFVFLTKLLKEKENSWERQSQYPLERNLYITWSPYNKKYRTNFEKYN